MVSEVNKHVLSTEEAKAGCSALLGYYKKFQRYRVIKNALLDYVKGRLLQAKGMIGAEIENDTFRNLKVVSFFTMAVKYWFDSFPPHPVSEIIELGIRRTHPISLALRQRTCLKGETSTLKACDLKMTEVRIAH